MQQLAVALVLLLAIVVAGRVVDDDRYRQVKQINPIMRYWANSRLRRKLPLLEEMAARKKQDGGDNLKYRNCFFSPVQCQLPVVIERDPLVSALKIEPQSSFLRFRRFP